MNRTNFLLLFATLLANAAKIKTCPRGSLLRESAKTIETVYVFASSILSTVMVSPSTLPLTVTFLPAISFTLS